MVMVRGMYAQLMAPGAHEAFEEQAALEQRDLEYPQVFNLDTSDSAYEDDFEVTGLGRMPTKLEGEAITYDDIIEGGSYRFTHTTYGQGARASFELLDDDKYGIIKKVPSNFARTSRHSLETNAWNVFNLGFTTQVTTDGISLFNTAHPLLGGAPATTAVPAGILGSGVYSAGTYPNRPGVDIDLSYSGIQLMINQCERMIDGRGILVKCSMKTVIHPPELQWVAQELFNPVGGFKPYTADNTPNVIANKGITPLMVHYLTSVSAWFAVADRGYHSVRHFDRQKLDQAFDDDFDTRSVKWIAFYRASDGVTRWRGTWGSNGP